MRPGDVRTGSTQRIRDLAIEEFEPVHPDLRVNVELGLANRQRLGEPPIVVFVCENERKAREFVERADRQVTGCVSTAGVPAADWPYPGRNRTFFVCERDVHLGTLRGYRLPKLPPEVRTKQGERGCEPEQVEFAASKLLQRNRRAVEFATSGK